MRIFHQHAQDLPAQPGSADNFTGDVQVLRRPDPT